MKQVMTIESLQTLAHHYDFTQTQTQFGGVIQTFNLVGTLWGDFKPNVPIDKTTADGDHYVAQIAEFFCRSQGALRRGSRLKIKGLDWGVLSVDEDGSTAIRVRLERVHP